MMGRAGRVLEVSSGPAEDQSCPTKEPRLSPLRQDGGVLWGYVCVGVRSPGALTP